MNNYLKITLRISNEVGGKPMLSLDDTADPPVVRHFAPNNKRMVSEASSYNND